MERGRLLVGTSGFAYKEWIGVLYPAGTKAAGMLACYAETFPTVEINYTFRRTPAASTLEKWVSSTPEGFTFACKAPMGITHFARLTGAAGERLDTFLTALEPLGDRLGPVLVQCPPNLKYDPGVLDDFLAHLAGRPQRFAMEFRHESFDTDDVRDKLAGAGVAWVAGDTEEREGRFALTAPGFGYVRLRRGGYSDRALAAWAKPIAAALDTGADVYCYLKHEGKATAPRDAVVLQAHASGPTPIPRRQPTRRRRTSDTP